MKPIRAVVDTNVVLSALRSNRGTSHRLLRLVGDSRWRMQISVALALQYEAIARREAVPFHATVDEADKFVDFLCASAEHHAIYYSWRPQLPDADDEFILDLAVASSASHIITFNKSDFVGVEKFGVIVVEPREFLSIIGEAI